MRQILIDGHNITAATRTFELAPRASAGTNTRRLLHILAAGGCTVTVSHTGDDAAHMPAGAANQLGVDVWQNVTLSCQNLNTAGPVTAASWVDTNATLDLSHLLGRVLVTLVTSDATNDVRLIVDEGPGTAPSATRSLCGTWTPATAAAPDDSAIITNTACKIERVMAVNTHATITYYLMLFDLAAVPADGVAPRYPAIPLVPGQAVVLDFGGTAHANGLCWSDSTTIATKTIAATTPFQVSAEIV